MTRVAASGGRRADAAEDPVALRSERWMGFFHIAFRRTFGGSMRALRVPHWGVPDVPAGRPLVVLANHPSWLDAVMFMLLLRRYFLHRPGFMPMDAAAFRKYGFMKRLGVFGIEQDSARGAVSFLQTAKHVLAAPDRMLWMNAPGRFADVRERPVPVAAGVVRLPEIAPHALFVPLAFEYPFWTERQGEALAAFGPAIPGEELAAMDRETRAEAIRAALTSNMDRLAEDAISRDPERFVIALDGRRGMGGLYGAWQYMKALSRGERHVAEHAPEQKRPG